MKETQPSPLPPPNPLRTPLFLILAVMLVRLGMDYSPFGKTDAATIVGLVALYAGFGLILLTFVLVIRGLERPRD
jgi:hypothetical protein